MELIGFVKKKNNIILHKIEQYCNEPNSVYRELKLLTLVNTINEKSPDEQRHIMERLARGEISIARLEGQDYTAEFQAIKIYKQQYVYFEGTGTITHKTTGTISTCQLQTTPTQDQHCSLGESIIHYTSKHPTTFPHKLRASSKEAYQTIIDCSLKDMVEQIKKPKVTPPTLLIEELIDQGLLFIGSTGGI